MFQEGIQTRDVICGIHSACPQLISSSGHSFQPTAPVQQVWCYSSRCSERVEQTLPQQPALASPRSLLEIQSPQSPLDLRTVPAF